MILYKEFNEDHIDSIIVTHECWASSCNIIAELLTVFWFEKGHLFSVVDIDPNEIAWKSLIRKRISKILYVWITEYPSLLDNESKNMLIDFILDLKQSNVVSKSITNILAKAMKQLVSSKSGEPTKSTPQSVLSSSWMSKSFVDISPKELAKQIALYDSSNVAKIKLRSLNRYSRGKKSSIQRHVERSKSIQRWILTEILSSSSMHLIMIKVSNFIQLCQYCVDLHNYHTAYDIYKALQDSKIQDIKSIWVNLNRDLFAVWENITQMLSSESDFFDMALEASVPKVLPLFLVLKFISSLEREPSFQDDNHTVNFSKCKAIYQIVKPIIESQHYQYKFTEDPKIQQFLHRSIVYLPEDELKAASQEIVVAHSDRVHFQSLRTSRTPKKRVDGPTYSLSARERTIERIIVPRKTTSTHTVTNLIKKRKTGEELSGQIQAEILEKWKRPLSKCSVGQDLPRFAKKITVVNGNNIVFGNRFYNDDMNVSHTIRELLFVLAVQMDAKKELKAMENSFHLYFGKEECDILKESDRFAKEIFGENSKLSSLLKAACTQGIVSPAWIKLKLDILDGYPFKDMKKGWNIGIIFNQKDIVVVHRKSEISVNENEEVLFQFTWELTMKFTKKMDTMISSMLNIVELEIKNLPDKKIPGLKTAIKYWYNPKLEKFPSFSSKKMKRRSIGDEKKLKKRASLPL